MFAFNASFTHMVQWHFFQIHAIDHILRLLKTCHVEVAKSYWKQLENKQEMKHSKFMK
jgi:hypothetical protein